MNKYELGKPEIVKQGQKLEIEPTIKPLRGAKNDQQEGKQRWHAMPLVMLHPLADAYNAGLKKYWRFSCLEKFDDPDWRFWDATMRHLEACQVDPLAKDEETGCYHAACACFNMLMRLYHCRKEQNGQPG